MSKKKERIDVNAAPETLTDNPFAALASQLPKDLPEQSAVEAESKPKAELLPPQGSIYQVGRTKKGSYDITFERRAKGKGVTVLSRVDGDVEALLKKLRKKCGAGGTVHDDCIELQGDHRATLQEILRDEGL